MKRDTAKPINGFSSFIAQQTKNFTGRDWVFAAIDQWLADPNAARYFIITGEPGIGKTAIAAKLTQIRDITATHFCVARQGDTIDPLNFTRSISHQLTQIEDFALGILEDKGLHIDIHVDIRMNYGKVIGVQIENLLVEAPSANIAFNRAVIDPLMKLYANGYSEKIVILIDALDEAVQYHGPKSIMDLIANTYRLPPQVRFLLTSRPEGMALRHFEQLRISILELDIGQAANLKDVQEYVCRQLETSQALQARIVDHNMSSQQFIDRITTASRGNFLYIVWLLRAVAEGTQEFGTFNSLPDGLDTIYREFLRTRTVGEDIRQWRTVYRPLLGVLVAAQAPLKIEQLTRFTGKGEQDVDDFLIDTQQFLDPMLAIEGQYQLYHQSVSDFLQSKENAGEFWIDVTSVHQQITARYEAGYIQHWRDCDLYGFRYLPSHLVGARQFERLRKLLCDFNWLQAKLDATDITFVSEDYGLFPDDAELCLVQSAINLSADVLASDKSQLAGQMIGRLLSRMEPEIQGILKEAKNWRGKPWLQPLTPSLISAGGPLIRTLTDKADSIVVTADGQRIISISSDTIRVWNLESGLELRMLKSVENPKAVTPDGRKVISALYDHTLKVWDLESGTEMLTLHAHKDTVAVMTVTPDNQRAICATRENNLQVWDLESGKMLSISQLHHEGEIIALRVSQDGRRLIVQQKYTKQTASNVASYVHTQSLTVWDLMSGVELFVLHDIGDVLTITPDGRRAISAIAYFYIYTLSVWDLENGIKLCTLRDRAIKTTVLAVTPDGQRAICVSIDLSRYNWTSRAPHILELWDLDNAHVELTLEQVEKNVDFNIQAVAVVTQDGRHAITAIDHDLKVWDLENGESSLTLSSHTDRVTALAVTPDGSRAVSASLDQTIKVWNLKSVGARRMFQNKQSNSPVKGLAVTADGRLAISVSTAGIRIWDIYRKTVLRSIRPRHHDSIFIGDTQLDIAALSADGRWVVANMSANIGIAHPDFYLVPTSYLELWDLESNTQSSLYATVVQGGKHYTITALTITLNARYVISGFPDYKDNKRLFALAVWSQSTGKRIIGYHADRINALVTTPDGKRVISASDDGTLKIWNIVEGKLLLSLRGHAQPINSVIVTADCKHFVSASTDGTIKVWNLSNGAEVRMLKGDANKLALTPDNRRLVIVAETLRVLEIENGKVTASFKGDSPFSACAVAPDGVTIIGGEESGNIHFLRLKEAQ